MNDFGNAILLVTGLIGYGIYQYPKWKNHHSLSLDDPSTNNNNNNSNSNNDISHNNNIDNHSYNLKDTSIFKEKILIAQQQQQQEHRQEHRQEKEKENREWTNSSSSIFDTNNQIKRRIFDK
ncbi:hypothetical protein CYY_007560 [Polysphondylium violaceum]|uniref:Uncharacterized protein n=1 Tax=Polysphondylium violaceum TaxID=133409 RepID=A0A8J4UQT5_9MYCE|nr:hypothetical protein CYY_007560 [Polysphondylium violaceum]